MLNHQTNSPECSLQLIQDKSDRTSLLLSDFDMSIVDSASADEKHGLVGTMGYTAPGQSHSLNLY